MNSYVDCHCHGLWDVDDGIQDKKDTLVLLQTAHDSHIKRIFMTPHMNVKGKYMPSSDQIHFKLQQLRLMIVQNKLDIEVKLGQELLVDAFGLEYIQTKQHRAYEDTDYVLCEFSVFGFNPLLIDQAIYELSLHHQTMILAHPERYFETEEMAIKTVRHWIKQGAYIQ
ncbi:MAG: CpsB/CapC family capsule biosynthesis tyrosine phosphatase, partial [Erysipelotrichaceae bacterium]